MKRTLYLKLLGGYLLFGLLGFLIIATFTYHLTFQHLEKKEAQNLYRESALISSSYAQNYFSNSMTLDEINEQLSALGTYLNADIWIVDTHGKILINTAGTENTDETIPDFDMTDFGNRYYRVGTFYDYFQENMLSVFSPITVNYKVRGYVIIHKSESYLTASANSLSAIAYTTLALIFAAAFVVLALFTYVVYIPIRKITHAADEYSKGNFDAKIDVHSNDEIGYLAASLNYMANELNTLEEEQWIGEWLNQANDTVVLSSQKGRFLRYGQRAYLPQILGLGLGRTLGLSYVATVFLGKFFNLLFCTAVVTCAIRFSKYGKRTLMCVGLLPTTVFLFSSFTYDAFVIALLMLGIALFVTEYLSEEKIQTKRTMVSILAMVVGCFSKAVYIPFLALYWLMPKDKFYSRR